MAVLVAVANHADDKGFGFPSQATLGDECQCTQKTVRTALQAMEKALLLTRTRRWKKDGHRSSDALQLHISVQEVKSTARDESLTVNSSLPTGKIYPASILNQSLNLKEESKMVWKVMQADGPLLDRFKDADVWKHCEKAMGQKVPVFMGTAHFPSDRVLAAREAVEGKQLKRA